MPNHDGDLFDFLRLPHMFRTTRITSLNMAGHHGFGAAFRAVRSQPGWITRLALLTVFIIIGLPIFLLVMLALIAGVLVFGVLAGVNMLIARIREGLPRNDGRKNVRVIQRIE